jgi:hypothetical protein
MKKSLAMDINVGIGDHLFLRIFLDGVRDQYERIAITHSKPGMEFWHNNNQARWAFNLQLGALVFNEPPYVLVPNARFPFYPNERIVKELNNKPVRPNFDQLCVGKSIDVDSYVVLTTKVREFPKELFEEMKTKLTPALQNLAGRYKIVILGERDVQRTKEYEAECNRQRVFGIYDYFTSILPPDRIVDLTIPALGIIPSTMSQFQQDCLIMKEARAVVTFGMGGNFWIATSVARTVGLRADTELERLSINIDYPSTLLTKDPDQFVGYLTKI